MKNKKVSMLIAASAAAATMLVATPSVSSFANTIKHEKNTKADNTKVENQDSTTKNVQVNNIKKITNNETKSDKSEKNLNRVDLAQVNLFTGKVVKAPKTETQSGATGFAVNFNGSNHMTYYNNQNLNPDMVQTEFHSKTQQELYNYLMNPNNRWNAENEAIGLHGGDTANDCVFFVSSALRAIGINIPDNIGYTTNLMSQLQNLGWERETDLSTLEPGDICFASTAHTYVFMGWANKAEGVAWVADNQFSWFGTNFHPRAQASVPNVDVSPTTCYYRLPGNYSVTGNKTQVDMPVNYDYSVGTVNTQGLNVRQEPSLDSSILTCLNYGQRVQILSQNGNWLKINYNGQPAYVWASYITGNTPSVTKPYEGNYNVIGNGVVNFTGGSYTDVMSGGTWYSNLRGTLNNGVKVSIINQNADWYQIEYENGTAWIPKNRLQTDLSYKVIGSGTVAFNGGNYTDIMSEGTWYSNVLGTLNNGTDVKIIGENTDWYKIEYNNGVAWILKSRLQTDLNTKVIGTGKVAFNSGSFTDIMSEGTWYSNVLGTLNNGTNINIIGENAEWYEIQYNNGTAWIPKNRTEVNRKIIEQGQVNFLSGNYTDIMSEGTWYSNVAGTLNNGTNINIVGQNAEWFEIEYNNGTVWIPKNRVHINRKVLEKGQINFLSGNYTDIMSEGTWYSNVAGTLNNGTNVKIIGENAEWFEIEYENGLAWVPKARVNTNIDRKVIQTGFVNFLGGSYTDIMTAGTWYSDVAGTLTNGTNVNIVSQKNNWYEIEYGNGTVWIPVNRVNTLHDTVLGTGTVEFSGGSYTDVMSAGTWYSNVIGTLNNGTNINIIGESGNWYQIEVGNTNVWIPKDRVNTTYGKPAIKTAYINFSGGNFTDIMNGPTWYTSLAGTLVNGTQVSIVGESGNWYEIEYENGTAWVLKDRVGTSQDIYQNAIYSQTMSEYVAQELQEYIDCVGGGLSASQVNQVTNELANAINPQNASTILEFLRIDEYRNVNFNQVQSLLNGKGVFSGQAAAFIGAAKQYNLDPVYLISQSALETGWGTSNFAKGITITQIANENAPIYQNGQLVGYQMINLPQPVTVYDLFGIGAYNASANFPNKTTILATTYAYNHGWTNISNAIYGAAAFLSNNYVHNNDIAQNTPYEIRYIDAPQEDIWHQYATDIQYAESIANIMENIKYVYSQGDSFTFEIPKFQN